MLETTRGKATTDALVVGAGSVSLTMACELPQHGIRSRPGRLRYSVTSTARCATPVPGRAGLASRRRFTKDDVGKGLTATQPKGGLL